MKRYFLKEDSENCFAKQYFIDYMIENNLTSIEVWTAKIERNAGYFYCHAVDAAGEKDECCGKMCPMYKPRNGVNGICKEYGFCYSPDKLVTLKLKL